ncbi:phospholipid/cholesterol/gamma-HCH transport system substrate-binding protein [Nocardia transvalensis]|uniref:Phospholipid/cholesterol/gamma-HCH transport system substrate-binding protein n=1 Tax=Nocardia transvalensis TaxID=37333 RepID=A0A7W9PLA8_9NOCA|nr:MlaD family protein [Nocardia transvalensis]MBB5918260.1 phospholipid/cholesterol/gamma-HCH transport system substrate-binding protein [Nocardia transvalensis]
MSTRSLLIRVSIVVALMAVALAAVFRVVERPVAGDTDTYTAMFTDANGLRLGDDVRLHGVQVGKVRAVELSGTLARVRFTVERAHPLFTESRPAIRYQNLSGFRYLDIEQPDQPGTRRNPSAVFGTSETVPAFDITTLFKGLQPVLAELSPDDLNRFATSMLAVIQGDGTGLGPALDAIEKLSRLASDRQAVLSTLVGNLGQIADHLGGRSGNAMKLLSNLTGLFTAIAEKLPGLVDFSYAIPPVLQPIRDIMNLLGVTGDRNQDLDALLHNVFPAPQEAANVFGRLPGLIQTIASTLPPTGRDAQMTCSHGAAVAPPALQVLLAGQRITLCHPS